MGCSGSGWAESGLTFPYHTFEWMAKRLLMKQKCLSYLKRVGWMPLNVTKKLKTLYLIMYLLIIPKIKYTYLCCLHSKLIIWTHISPASGHSGTKRTLELIQSKYWWDSMAKEVNEFVASSSIYAQAKVPQHFLEGKFMPLENPHCPWSHIALDFLTDHHEYVALN